MFFSLQKKKFNGVFLRVEYLFSPRKWFYFSIQTDMYLLYLHHNVFMCLCCVALVAWDMIALNSWVLQHSFKNAMLPIFLTNLKLSRAWEHSMWRLVPLIQQRWITVSPKQILLKEFSWKKVFDKRFSWHICHGPTPSETVSLKADFSDFLNAALRRHRKQAVI